LGFTGAKNSRNFTFFRRKQLLLPDWPQRRRRRPHHSPSKEKIPIQLQGRAKFFPAREKSRASKSERRSPFSTDAGIEPHGLSDPETISEMRAAVENLAKFYPTFYTILLINRKWRLSPRKSSRGWLKLVAPQANVTTFGQQSKLSATSIDWRKSPFFQEAIDLSLDAHVEAMKNMRPDLFEYQVALQKMVESPTRWVLSEAEGLRARSSPRTKLTRRFITDKLDQQNQRMAYIVVLDVGRTNTPAIRATSTRTASRKRQIAPHASAKSTNCSRRAECRHRRPSSLERISGPRTISKACYHIAYNYINSQGRVCTASRSANISFHGSDIPSASTFTIQAAPATSRSRNGRHHRAGNLHSRGKSRRPHRRRFPHHGNRRQIPERKTPARPLHNRKNHGLWQVNARPNESAGTGTRSKNLIARYHALN